MNLAPSKPARPGSHHGSAVLVLMLFLSTMMLMVAATTQSAIWLRSEIRLLERRQVERLQRLSAENASTPAQPQNRSATP